MMQHYWLIDQVITYSALVWIYLWVHWWLREHEQESGWLQQFPAFQIPIYETDHLTYIVTRSAVV